MSEFLANSNLEKFAPYIKPFLLCIIAVIIGIVCQKLAKKLISKAAKVKKLFNASLFEKRINMFVRIAIWLIVGVTCTDILGIDIGPAIAGLGVSGIIVGLALQDTISNVFAGIMAYKQGTLKTGDYVDLGSVNGTVVEHNFYCVKLLTSDHRYVTITNKSFWSNPIVNYNISEDRRIDMVLNVACKADVEQIMAKSREILDSYPDVLHDQNILIGVSSVTDRGVQIVVRPWCKPAAYWDIYWRFQTDMYKYLKELGNAFPYAALDINVQNNPAISAKV